MLPFIIIKIFSIIIILAIIYTVCLAFFMNFLEKKIILCTLNSNFVQ